MAPSDKPYMLSNCSQTFADLHSSARARRPCEGCHARTFARTSMTHQARPPASPSMAGPLPANPPDTLRCHSLAATAAACELPLSLGSQVPLPLSRRRGAIKNDAQVEVCLEQKLYGQSTCCQLPQTLRNHQSFCKYNFTNRKRLLKFNLPRNHKHLLQFNLRHSKRLLKLNLPRNRSSTNKHNFTNLLQLDF